jgi:UDP-N-acetylglucosamine transferase subunit ALG13
MIFVTAGTTNFPFRRLEEVVLCLQKLYPKTEIIFQNSRIIEKSFSTNVRLVDFFAPSDFEKMLKKARTVISHAGYATIMKTLRFSKTKPIVIPRLKKYNEHVNDHQKYFASYLEDKGLVKVVTDIREIDRAVKELTYDDLFVRKYLQDTKKRTKKLIEYLNNITSSD